VSLADLETQLARDLALIDLGGPDWTHPRV
jgi:hypothetical protein